MLKKSVTNLALRGTSLAAKFMLPIIIGKQISLEAVGEYGLMMAVIAIGSSLIGLELRYVIARHVITAPLIDRVKLIRDQFTVYLIAYIVGFFIIIIIGMMGLFDKCFLGWFYPLLILSHMHIELISLFNAISEPVFAEILYFIGAGSWIFLLYSYCFFFQQPDISLTMIWSLWILGLLICVPIALMRVIHWPWSAAVTHFMSRDKFQSLIICAFPFWIIAVSERMVVNSARFFLELYSNTINVGIFTLFSNYASLITLIVGTGFSTIYYPQLLNAASENDFAKKQKAFLMGTAVWSAFGLIITALALPFFLHVIPAKAQSVSSVFITGMILGYFALNFQGALYYIYYAKGFEKEYACIALCMLVLNSTLNYWLIKRYDIEGAVSALLITALLGIFILAIVLRIKLKRGS